MGCHELLNEYVCEHSRTGCDWCTLNKGVSYSCYTDSEARKLNISDASCSRPIPAPPVPTPPPAPTPAPAPAGPCFMYTVMSGDDCYDLETYYGTKNITTMDHLACSAKPLAVGENLEVCGCTLHCSAHPTPAVPTPAVPTPPTPPPPPIPGCPGLYILPLVDHPGVSMDAAKKLCLRL